MDKVSGIILMGGKSSRMGKDKALTLFKGKPLYQYSVDALKPLVSEIILISDKNEHQQLPYRVISDAKKNCGPLAGLISGLSASSNYLSFVLPCDIPFIDSRSLEKILKPGISKPLIAENSEGVHYTIGLYPKDCVKSLAINLSENILSLKNAFNKLNGETIFFTELKPFKNINYQDQILEYED